MIDVGIGEAFAVRGFAAFSYVANYIYDGDAPLAERRAQALSIDQSQLEELLGDTDLRELLDPAALDEVEAALQSLEPEYRAQHADGVHDLLLKLGDLSEAELLARSVRRRGCRANNKRTRRCAACGASAHRGRISLHSGGVRGALSRCSGHAAAAGARRCFPLERGRRADAKLSGVTRARTCRLRPPRWPKRYGLAPDDAGARASRAPRPGKIARRRIPPERTRIANGAIRKS